MKIQHIEAKDITLSNGTTWLFIEWVFGRNEEIVEPDFSMYPEEYYDRRYVKRQRNIIYYIKPELFAFLLLKYDIEKI